MADTGPVFRSLRDGGSGLPLLLLVALLARIATFGDPIVHVDEEFYFVTARAMAHGAWPYVDIWDRKPVGLFLLYLPFAALPLRLGICAYQLAALFCVVATSMLIVRMARRAGWASGAMVAGMAYILWLDLAEGQGGQAPVFYNLPVAAAATLLMGERAASVRRACCAMALLGVALQIKYSVVFEGLLFGLWSLRMQWRAHRPTRALATGVITVALALLPTLLVGAVYLAHGHFDAFWYANFDSILHRRPDPPAERWGNLAQLVGTLAPLVALASVAMARSRHNLTPDRVFLFSWLGAAAGGALAFGGWFDHYALPVMVPAATCAAGALDHARVRRLAAPLLLVVAIGGQALVIHKLFARGTAARFEGLARLVGSGPGCLYVYSGETMLYPWTGRCRLSPYVFPSHLGRERERGAIGVDQEAEVRRILAARPAVIVMHPAYRGERAEVRAIVLSEVARDYREKGGARLGNEVIRVFERMGPATDARSTNPS